MEDNRLTPLRVMLASDGNGYVTGDDTAREMALIREFLVEGREHGTVVEALHTVLHACLTGQAESIDWALGIGASEWYK